MFSLEFVSYDIGEPKYSVDECQERDLTFSVPLKATLRLRIREEVDGEKRDKEIIEQEVYLGELPMITDKGTFIINGAERVIVSQLHRSPGVFFDEQHPPERQAALLGAHHPYRGSWVEFSIDVNDIMYVHIDRKRKLAGHRAAARRWASSPTRRSSSFSTSDRGRRAGGAQPKRMQA